MSSLFNFNNQQNQQQNPISGSLFPNSNTNSSTLFGAKPDNNKQTGLFGNLNATNNTNNNQTTSDNKGILFGNLQSGGNNNTLFGTQNKDNNKNIGSLFGTSNSNLNAPNPIFGNFQNSNTNNTDKTKSNIFIGFGAQNNTQSVQNTQGNNEQKKDTNAFSIFNNNNQSNTQEKPKDNNLNEQNKQSSLFPNTQPGINKLGEGNSIFGVKEEKKEETNNNNITQNQKKEKEEPKQQNALFGNNINIQTGTGNLFGNSSNKEKTENKNPLGNININSNQATNSLINTNNNVNQNQNQNDQNQNNPNNNDSQINKVRQNQNNLNIKIPEKPFEFNFGNSKELEEYEKNQLLYKTNNEIVEDFKNILFNQKTKYKQCVKNTREFERKLMGIIEITNTNALMSEINAKNGQKIIDRITSINYQSKNLENILNVFNDKLGDILSPYKNNVMNSDKIFLNENNSEKFKFYENISQVSEKCFLIENTLNEAEQNFNKKEKETQENNKNMEDGLWIERKKGKIFLNQNELNNLFSECYDGLSNLKSMQDNIDQKYELLKLKILKNNENGYNNITSNNYNY